MDEHTSKKVMQKSKTGKSLPTKIEAREKFPFYMGIDLGEKYSEFCVFNAEGEVEKRFRLRTHGGDWSAYFKTIPRSAVALEAGAQSRWAAELIESCGHKVYVSNVRKVPYLYQADDKDDPGDAFKLGELLYLKPRLLHPIQHRSREMQQDLTWIRAREALVESRTQLVNTVRGLSKTFGNRLVKCSVETFTRKRADELSDELRRAVAPLLETLDVLTEQIDYYDQMLKHIAQTRYPKYRLLDQVAGVGVHTALAFMLTIGDPERFEKSRLVGSFLGMRPRRQDSGEQQPQLGITKTGDPFLRKTLVNCAQHILGAHGKDSDLRRFGLRICEHGGKNAKKRAVIAVARKLAVLLHRLWVSGEVYEPLRNSERLAATA